MILIHNSSGGNEEIVNARIVYVAECPRRNIECRAYRMPCRNSNRMACQYLSIISISGVMCRSVRNYGFAKRPGGKKRRPSGARRPPKKGPIGRNPNSGSSPRKELGPYAWRIRRKSRGRWCEFNSVYTRNFSRADGIRRGRMVVNRRRRKLTLPRDLRAAIDLSSASAAGRAIIDVLNLPARPAGWFARALSESDLESLSSERQTSAHGKFYGDVFLFNKLAKWRWV